MERRPFAVCLSSASERQIVVLVRQRAREILEIFPTAGLGLGGARRASPSAIRRLTVAIEQRARGRATLRIVTGSES